MVMLAVTVFGINTGIANAALVDITGGMGITGNYTADSTTLTFNSVTGTSGTDDLSSVGFGTSGTVFNGVIVYDPFAPVANVFQIGGWQMDLSALIVDPLSTIDKLKLSGTGLLSCTDLLSCADFADTAATWTFSANSASSYSMSITAAATVVPVPAAVWLFGSGLLGLVGVARRKV